MNIPVWVFVVLMLGAFYGGFMLCAVLAMGKRADERIERMRGSERDE